MGGACRLRVAYRTEKSKRKIYLGKRQAGDISSSSGWESAHLASLQSFVISRALQSMQISFSLRIRSVNLLMDAQ